MFVKTFSIVAIAAVATFAFADAAHADNLVSTSNYKHKAVVNHGGGASAGSAASIKVEDNVRQDRDNLVSTANYRPVATPNIGGGKSAGASSSEAIAPADNVREYSRFDHLGD